MLTRTFQISHNGVVPLVGREKEIETIKKSIYKDVPDHLQVVGPRFSGKTVLLQELKNRIESDDCSPYTATLLWDLGHQTPKSDLDFFRQFSLNLVESIKNTHQDLADYLESSDETYYQDIAEVLETLNDISKVLVIFDGFDKPLSSSSLTRNLWDQLRELAQNKSLTLITASRNSLRELIRNPDAQTSDFWNIFLPTPFRLNCFDENEVAEILSHHCKLAFDKGALTELFNSTNGNPILLFEVLNYLLDFGIKGSFSNVEVKNAVNNSYESNQHFIEELWNDCSPSTQDALRVLAEEEQIDGVSQDTIRSVIEKGFGISKNNRLSKPSRLLKMYLSNSNNESSSIDRLFKKQESFNVNFNSVIAKRIEQIGDIDPTLNRYLQRSLEDLPNHPEVCLSGIRGIIDQCFELIWDAEFGGKKIPDGHFHVWEYQNDPRIAQEFKSSFPQGAKRLKLLKVLTGFERIDPLAKVVSKSTCVALCALNPFGDFGQHQEGENMTLQMVYSAVLLAVELVESLQSDIIRSKNNGE